jgi:hypothetical protein
VYLIRIEKYEPEINWNINNYQVSRVRLRQVDRVGFAFNVVVHILGPCFLAVEVVNLNIVNTNIS